MAARSVSTEASRPKRAARSSIDGPAPHSMASGGPSGSPVSYIAPQDAQVEVVVGDATVHSRTLSLSP